MGTFRIKGTVIEGKRLGRKLGFPTANIAVGKEIEARDGVYAARVSVGGRDYEAMANLGYRPSVAPDSHERLLEVNLFEFEGSLYGQQIEVELLEFIRPERAFASVDELREAVEADRNTILKYFKTRCI